MEVERVDTRNKDTSATSSVGKNGAVLQQQMRGRQAEKEICSQPWKVTSNDASVGEESAPRPGTRIGAPHGRYGAA